MRMPVRNFEVAVRHLETIRRIQALAPWGSSSQSLARMFAPPALQSGPGTCQLVG
jgi:hypothetical protein